jgi:hypothetical protein
MLGVSGIQYPFWIAAALMLSVSFLTLRMQPAVKTGETEA